MSDDSPDMTPVYMAGLLLAGRPVLVVGGGSAAARKVRHLVHAQAEITIVAPALCDALQDLDCTWHDRAFEPADLEGQALVIAATDDPALNAEILRLARERGIIASAVDENWADGDFITLATAYRGQLQAAIRSGDPKRSAELRRALEAWLAGQDEPG